MMTVLTWKNDWEMILTKMCRGKENLQSGCADCHSLWFGFISA